MTFPVAGLISLQADGAEALPLQICRQIRDAIVDTTLPAGARLPSSRRLAGDLGVSRNTVLAAFEQLGIEGYLQSRTGAGTFVAATTRGLAVPERPAPPSGDTEPGLSARGRVLASIDRSERPGGRAFRPGVPDVRLFPHDLWGRLLRSAARAIEPHYCGYGHFDGLPALKAAIAKHLAETRGVVAEPSQVLVISSAQAALDLSARMLIDPGDVAGLEDPGYKGALVALLGAGAEIADLPVDAEGVDLAGYRGALPKLIYLTPSHQYPLGATLSLERRLAILELARAANAHIVEDDYDSEFHYRSRPIPALAGLDGLEGAGRVIYLGTFAKTMMPSIRVAFMVLPKPLVTPFRMALRNTGQVPAAVVQVALAKFLDEGHFRAHIRRVGAVYRRRRDFLVEQLAARCPQLQPDPVPDGGMQLAVFFRDPSVDDQRFAEALAVRGVDCTPLGSLFRGSGRAGLALGFAIPDEAEISAGIETIAAVCREFGL
ncbi:MocR-like pyridoxine biosynthesis transcription factor PdxR [Rhodobium gokarnense]|uniref:GntR family transcriptional regulator/MocR family aminotransferase n=1 Tax=Rhodobium gokarnense TaxID=364296 RepID=A0ABT3H9G9_9HYPH|nr:PLP-dependent aminotransferase family protein [Rhodobium gokarnense]MCW2307046.1 GntR family transcriptional regulator/MocR family aminotransferase [Rhodobium gokarnense]